MLRFDRTAALVVALAACAVFLNALPGDFVYDDILLVRDNDLITRAANIPRILTDQLWGLTGKPSPYYRPLPPLVFMGVYHAAGLQPWAFRLVNLLLHALASVLVLRLLRDLLRLRAGGRDAGRGAGGAAVLAALLFAVHPIHVEAVAWISGIMDVACTAFALLAFDLYRRADDTPRGRVRLALATLAYFLATLSKEPALALPLLVALYDLSFGRVSPAEWKRAARRWLPFVAATAIYLALRAYAIRDLPPREGEAVGASALLLHELRLLALYAGKLFVPIGLSPVTQLAPLAGWATPGALLSVAAGLGLAGATALAWLRDRAAFLGLSIFLLTLGPALLVPLLARRLSQSFAERYAYFPSVGWAVVVGCLVAAAAAWGPAARRAALALAGTVALVFAGATVAQNLVWRDALSLWTDAVRRYPGNAEVQYNYGSALFKAGRADEGRSAFRRARELDPQLVPKMVEAARGYLAQGLAKRAMFEMESALVVDPQSLEARLVAAAAYEAAGWSQMAHRHYEAAIALQPGNAQVRNSYGVLLAREGKLDAAIAQFEAAAQAAPRDTFPWTNLARAWELKGDAARATAARRQAEALAPR